MTDSHASNPSAPDWRDRLAANLGVSPSRKEQFYCDLIQSVTLTDITYWLQVIFAAGIATLGLVLNSPAVIIGAMLISPLMGPILANGMAFAAGDVVLAVRSIASLALSCVLAVTFAMLLIWLMPFKEQTAEILARTQPNALDLVIALFSGLLGSIATTKEPRGVVTSIPGVAIAVALMPPLCVVGYGIGISLSIDPLGGWPIARGGALLFFTNLTAITLMAMLVFVLLHIATPAVKQEVKDWHLRDGQSRWILSILRNLPASGRLRMVGSLPSRFIVILLPILILLAPLQASLKRLQADIQERQESIQIQKVAAEIWRNSFAQFSIDDPRAHPSNKDKSRAHLSELELTLPKAETEQLIVRMTVFTSEPYTPEERAKFTDQMAAELNRSPESILLQLLEIPITTYELAQREELDAPPELPTEEIPTVGATQQQFLNTVDSALAGLSLPEPAQLLHYDVVTNVRQPLRLRLVYLSPRAIGPDAQLLLTESILERLQFPQAVVQFERMPIRSGRVQFKPKTAELSETSLQPLDQLATQLMDYPQLGVTCQVQGNTENTEAEQALASQRCLTIRNYLAEQWQILPQRVSDPIDDLTGSSSAGKVDSTIELRLNLKSRQDPGS